jgi:RNA polymerase sigma-70 factor (ECF subfamily)
MSKNQKINPVLWAERYGDYLFKYALYRTGNPEAAEDVVQETFVAALKGLDTFQGKSQESTWLTGILKHKIADYYRGLNKKVAETEYDAITRQKPEESEDDNYLDKPSESWPINPAKTLEQTEFLKVLDRCMLKLPEKQYDVFSMRELDELTTAEICKKLNISESNFWVMLHRARSRLKKCIQVNWLDTNP